MPLERRRSRVGSTPRAEIKNYIWRIALRNLSGRVLSTLAVLIAFSAMSFAQHHSLTINVNCPKESITKALSHVDPALPVTINVSGTCIENLVIIGYTNVSLIGANGAALQDASGGQLPVVQIGDSLRVEVDNFTITGGITGIQCLEFSTCWAGNNTVQSVTGDGIGISRSRAHLGGNTIQNNAGRGLVVQDGATVLSWGDVITSNQNHGILVKSGSYLVAVSTTSSNNSGKGARVIGHSTLRAVDMVLQGNGATGLEVSDSSAANVEQGNTGTQISGNGGNGITLADQSFARFLGSNSVSGNLAQPDIECNPQFPATRGALSQGGTTNCVEP